MWRSPDAVSPMLCPATDWPLHGGEGMSMFFTKLGIDGDTRRHLKARHAGQICALGGHQTIACRAGRPLQRLGHLPPRSPTMRIFGSRPALERRSPCACDQTGRTVSLVTTSVAVAKFMLRICGVGSGVGLRIFASAGKETGADVVPARVPLAQH